MRILIAFFTFVLGIGAAGAVSSLFQFSLDAVPAIKAPGLEVDSSIWKDSTPKYIPFSESAARLGFYGWFVADEFAGMPEVWAVQLSYGADEGDAFVRTLPVGKDAEEQVSFVSSSLDVREDYFAFTTEKIDRVHYQFEGRFLYGGSSFSQQEKVLRGTLKKFRNGKVVAKFTTTFEYAEPYCTL